MTEYDSDDENNFYEWNLICKAILNQNNEVVEQFINSGFDVNMHGKNGYTPLMVAIDYGNWKAIQLLVENGANVNIKDNFGETAMHHAVDEKNLMYIKYLIENGADVFATNRNGDTPLLAGWYNLEDDSEIFIFLENYEKLMKNFEEVKCAVDD